MGVKVHERTEATEERVPKSAAEWGQLSVGLSDLSFRLFDLAFAAVRQVHGTDLDNGRAP